MVGTDERERLAGDHVTHNQNNSQEAIRELVCKSTVEALCHEIGGKGGSGARGERNDDGSK